MAVVVSRRPMVRVGDRPAPDPIGLRPTEGHPTIRSDQRVLVSTVWIVDEGQLLAFVDAMEVMRRIRMRTGAFRWTLYRDVVQPLRFTEVFEIHTWEQHLQQHERLDAEALVGIDHAMSFDRAGGPFSMHMVGVDRESVLDPAWSSVEVAAHDVLHRQDGSIPGERRRTPRSLDGLPHRSGFGADGPR